MRRRAVRGAISALPARSRLRQKLSRTALVLPWDVKPNTPLPQASLRDDDSDNAGAVAIVEAGVIANVLSCNGRWCRVTVDRFRGWIEQKKLWGVYAGEVVK